MECGEAQVTEIADVELAKEFGDGWFKAGFGCHPKQRKCPLMSVVTLQFLKRICDRGNKEKRRRMSADRCLILFQEEVAARDWHEMAIVTEARIKSFFSINAQISDGCDCGVGEAHFL